MRITKVLIVALCVTIAGQAYAELQNVEIGGSIRIRGNYFSSSTADSFNGRNPLVQTFFTGGFPRGIGAGIVAAGGGPLFVPGFIPAAAGGNPLAGLRYTAGQMFNRANGGFGSAIASLSGIDFNDNGHSNAFVEQRTLINFKADFTNDVSVFIELESYDIFGEDFRSVAYATGIDNRQFGTVGGSAEDVEIYQAYIQAEEMWGYPIHMRIGRQEMVLGTGWLIGNNTTSSFFTGLSFDGIMFGYGADDWTIDAFWAKIAERSPLEEDSDVNVAGLYGTYTGFDDISIDAYWIWLRDGTNFQDTFHIAEFTPLALLEDLAGVDQYDTTNVHTFGIRASGARTLGNGTLDFNAEIAYQFGDAAAIGFTFRKSALFGIPTYGDDDAEFGELAGEFELGYTFDINYQPRIWIGGAYFGGEDNRDLSFTDWLESIFNPFYTPEASVSFNRLFSNTEYSEFFTQLSNVVILRGGASFSPTETVDISLLVTYFNTLEAFDAPMSFRVLGTRFVPLAGLSFLTEENDSDLGWELGLYVDYQYSEDLVFRAGWSHFFTGDGAEQGNFVGFNGLGFEGGTGDDDLDYLFLETEISF